MATKKSAKSTGNKYEARNAKIKRLFDAGMTQSQIGEEMGIDQSRVSQVLRELTLPKSVYASYSRGEFKSNTALHWADRISTRQMTSDEVVQAHRIARDRAIANQKPDGKTRITREMADEANQEVVASRQNASLRRPALRVAAPSQRQILAGLREAVSAGADDAWCRTVIAFVSGKLSKKAFVQRVVQLSDGRNSFPSGQSTRKRPRQLGLFDSQESRKAR